MHDLYLLMMSSVSRRNGLNIPRTAMDTTAHWQIHSLGLYTSLLRGENCLLLGAVATISPFMPLNYHLFVVADHVIPLYRPPGGCVYVGLHILTCLFSASLLCLSL
jgi:hypothetical protein